MGQLLICTHFTDEEESTEKLGNLPKMPQVVSGQARTCNHISNVDKSLRMEVQKEY